jgi:putative peptide maturation system protein
VDSYLIQEEIERNPIHISDLEMQQGIDGFRRANKLYTPEATYAWMSQQGMSHDELEIFVANNIAIEKVRERVSRGLVEETFEKQRSDFDIVKFVEVVTDTEGVAGLAKTALLSSGEEFLRFAAEHLRDGGPGHSSPDGVVVNVQAVRRYKAVELEVDALFSEHANANDVVGPMRTRHGLVVWKILSYAPAVLDEATRHEVERAIFNRWLSDKRRIANIEWYWGRRTDHVDQ